MVLPPLFPSVPGRSERLLSLLLLIVIPALVGWWVYHDATARGSEWAWQWGVGIAVLFVLGLIPGLLFVYGLVPGLLGLILYLLLRNEQPRTV